MILKNVPSQNHKAAGGAAVYGQVDIPRTNFQTGLPQWGVRFETFRVNSLQHPGLYTRVQDLGGI